MKIALIGATGYVGTRLLTEALTRGHSVTAIARNINKLPENTLLHAVSVDIAETERLQAVLANHDAVIVAINCLGLNQAQLLKCIKLSTVPRVLLIGGAGSLRLDDGMDLVDSAQFPPQYRSEALAAREWLRLWRTQTDINWTFASPSALLIPGERTGRFRYGQDRLLHDENGKSSISLEDFSVAVIDEVEKSRYPQQRFTVGY